MTAAVENMRWTSPLGKAGRLFHRHLGPFERERPPHVVVKTEPVQWPERLQPLYIADWAPKIFEQLLLEGVAASVVVGPNPLVEDQPWLIRAINDKTLAADALGSLKFQPPPLGRAMLTMPAEWTDLTQSPLLIDAYWASKGFDASLVLRLPINGPYAFEWRLLSRGSEAPRVGDLLLSLLAGWAEIQAAMLRQQTVLSQREKECLLLAHDGHTQSEIALILGCADRTVEFHSRNACHKLNARDALAAFRNATLLGCF